MKRVLFLTPVVLAAMAGCAPAPNQIQAGQWEASVELTAVDLPASTPPEVRAQIQRQIGVAQTQPPQCLSDEQARNYLQELRGSVPPNCRVSDEVYAGGVIRTRISCTAQPGQPAVSFALDGNFTATTMNATITQEATPPAGSSQGPMRRTQRLHARRVGACPATPPTPTPTLPAQPPAGL
jgi:hypothetical protein